MSRVAPKRFRRVSMPEQQGFILMWEDSAGWRASLAKSADWRPIPGFGVSGFDSQREAYEAAVEKVAQRAPWLERFPSWEDQQAMWEAEAE